MVVNEGIVGRRVWIWSCSSHTVVHKHTQGYMVELKNIGLNIDNITQAELSWISSSIRCQVRCRKKTQIQSIHTVILKMVSSTCHHRVLVYVRFLVYFFLSENVHGLPLEVCHCNRYCSPIMSLREKIRSSSACLVAEYGIQLGNKAPLLTLWYLEFRKYTNV